MAAVNLWPQTLTFAVQHPASSWLGFVGARLLEGARKGEPMRFGIALASWHRHETLRESRFHSKFGLLLISGHSTRLEVMVGVGDGDGAGVTVEDRKLEYCHLFAYMKRHVH